MRAPERPRPAPCPPPPASRSARRGPDVTPRGARRRRPRPPSPLLPPWRSRGGLAGCRKKAQGGAGRQRGGHGEWRGARPRGLRARAVARASSPRPASAPRRRSSPSSARCWTRAWTSCCCCRRPAAQRHGERPRRWTAACCGCPATTRRATSTRRWPRASCPWRSSRRETATLLTIEKLFAEPRVPARGGDGGRAARATSRRTRPSSHEPEQVRAAQIVVKGLDEARRLQAQLKAGKKFADLARRYSLSADAKVGGDLGFFPAGRCRPAFDEVVFRLRVGQVSEVVRPSTASTCSGCWSGGRRASGSFAEVRAQVEAKLLAQRRAEAQEEYVQELQGAGAGPGERAALQAIRGRPAHRRPAPKAVSTLPIDTGTEEEAHEEADGRERWWRRCCWAPRRRPRGAGGPGGGGGEQRRHHALRGGEARGAGARPARRASATRRSAPRLRRRCCSGAGAAHRREAAGGADPGAGPRGHRAEVDAAWTTCSSRTTSTDEAQFEELLRGEGFTLKAYKRLPAQPALAHEAGAAEGAQQGEGLRGGPEGGVRAVRQASAATSRCTRATSWCRCPQNATPEEVETARKQALALRRGAQAPAWTSPSWRKAQERGPERRGRWRPGLLPARRDDAGLRAGGLRAARRAR